MTLTSVKRKLIDYENCIKRNIKSIKESIEEDPYCNCPAKCSLYAKKELNIFKNLFLMVIYLKKIIADENKEEFKTKAKENSPKIKDELFELLEFPFENEEQYLLRCNDLKTTNNLLTSFDNLLKVIDENPSLF